MTIVIWRLETAVGGKIAPKLCVVQSLAHTLDRLANACDAYGASCLLAPLS
jgi:hypothetical protein